MAHPDDVDFSRRRNRRATHRRRRRGHLLPRHRRPGGRLRPHRSSARTMAMHPPRGADQGGRRGRRVRTRSSSAGWTARWCSTSRFAPRHHARHPPGPPADRDHASAARSASPASTAATPTMSPPARRRGPRSTPTPATRSPFRSCCTSGLEPWSVEEIWLIHHPTPTSRSTSPISSTARSAPCAATSASTSTPTRWKPERPALERRQRPTRRPRRRTPG